MTFTPRSTIFIALVVLLAPILRALLLANNGVGIFHAFTSEHARYYPPPGIVYINYHHYIIITNHHLPSMFPFRSIRFIIILTTTI
jgi:hypothetical protein